MPGAATLVAQKVDAAGRHVRQIELCQPHCEIVIERELLPSFNQSFAVKGSPTGWWVSPYHFGVDQGPVVLMIENHRTGLLWEIMRRCSPILTGLRRAGFTGGWL